MSIVGILANSVSGSTGGNIVADLSGTLTHRFGSSSIWGHPALQSFSVQSDNVSTQPGAYVFVSEYVDANVKYPKQGDPPIQFIGLFASQCTEITYQMVAVQGGSASALCITEFFD